MVIGNDGMRASVSLDDASSLEMQLSRSVFTAGGYLSGVVILRLGKEISIRSLVVTVAGVEAVPPVKTKRLRHPMESFFVRELLLSGRDKPRFASERMSQYWNAFLRRDMCRALSAGEHTYPFSIPLPSSLPPSCEGRVGKISYSISARVQFPLVRKKQVCLDVPVAFASRELENEAFSLSHSSVFGGKHATGADISISLPSRGFALGSKMNGEITLSNPLSVEMRGITVTLDVFEGSRLEVSGEVFGRSVDTAVVPPELSAAQIITSDFELTIPSNAPPSVEGKSMLVTWSLGVSVDTSPPLEIRVPVIVHLPVT